MLFPARKGGCVMLDVLHARFMALATWPLIALLVAAYILIQLAFDKRAEFLGTEPSVPDVRTRGYTPQDIACLIRTWGPDKARLYAITQVTLDLVFPVVYGLLFATLMAQVYSSGYWRLFVLLPLIAVVTDLGE